MGLGVRVGVEGRMTETSEELWALLKTTGDVSFLRMNLNLTFSTFFFEWLCGQEVGLVKEMYPVTLFCSFGRNIHVIIIKSKSFISL